MEEILTNIAKDKELFYNEFKHDSGINYSNFSQNRNTIFTCNKKKLENLFLLVGEKKFKVLIEVLV